MEPELSAYADGEIAPPELDAVEAHLAACRRCAHELARLRHASAVLRRFDAEETGLAASTGFRNRVVAEVSSGRGHRATPSSGSHEPHGAEVRAGDHAGDRASERWLRIRPAFAAAAAATIVGALTWIAVRPSPGPAADVANLREEVNRLRAQVLADLGARPGDAAPSRAFDVQRVEAPEPSLAAVPDDGGGAGDPSAPAAAPSVWEPLDDGMLLQDAREAYDAWISRRRILDIEEKLAAVTRANASPAASSPAYAPPPSPVASWLAACRIPDGRFAPHEGVQVWPLVSDTLARDPRGGRDAPQALSLATAIDLRTLSVREDEDGAVTARNSDLKQRPVLLLAGDVLKGARQDRVVREDVLVAPGRSVRVPVFASGTARARTSYRTFTSSPLVAPVDVRALMGTALLGARVSQREMDEAVSAVVNGFGSPRGEGSLVNLFENPELQRAVDRYAEAFRKRLTRPDAVGFALTVGGRTVAIECFGDPATFAELRDRSLRSHLLFALESAAPAGRADDAAAADSAGDASALLAAARRSVYDDHGGGAGGLGAFRTVDGAVFGYGLTDAGRVVHAVVFAGVPETGAVAASRRGGGLRPTGPDLGTDTGPGVGPGRGSPETSPDDRRIGPGDAR